MSRGLEDRVALVTGGGRGIGREIALSLAREGSIAVVCDIAEDRAEETLEAIRSEGGRGGIAICDVTDGAGVRQMVDKVRGDLGSIEILVNNAGIPTAEDPELESGLSKDWFAQSDPADWERTINLIIYGVLNCTRAAVPNMVDGGWGRVVNIASDAGRIGEPALTIYSMAKAGVIGFSKALAKELGRNGITVNCVSPAFVVTDATATRLGEHAAKIMRRYPLAAGLDRLGQPEDIAEAVKFLSTDQAAWITGQVLSVNGGYSMVD